jgi:phosphate:Na+ symporter
MVSYGLNRAFGTMLRRIISNSTNNRFKAFFVGLSVAAILQSSTATSLIVSSFAARSVITVSAAIAVMLGADVGTTLAAQFMSLDLRWLAPVMITSGYIVAKSMEETQYKHVGRAMIGIGLALVALKAITAVAEPLKHSEVLQALTGPLSDQPILAVMISALITWLVHSSLGMVLLYMSFVGSGTIPVELGLFMVLGANIGGALAPVVMTLRDIPAGRRVPLGNLVIRGLGVIFVMPFMSSLILPYIELLHPNPARMLVNFHTAFNIGVALIFLPFIVPLTRLSQVVLPDRPRDEDESLPRYLDPIAISTPPAALACVSRETLRICDIVQGMLRDTLEAFRVNNARLVKDIRDREAIVDSLYESIKTYLSRLSGESLSKEETRRYMQILNFSTNLEHVGDIIDNSMMEMAMKKIRNQDTFSRQGFAEIAAMHAMVMENMQLAHNVFMTGDIAMARKMFEAKTTLRSHEKSASEGHFKRLSEGVAETIATSSLHLDLLRDLRQINTYISMIAYPILEEAKELSPLVLKTPRATKGKGKTTKQKPSAPLPEKY